MIYACPICLQSIQNISERCSSCGLIFDPAHWPKEAYSLNGLIPNLEIKSNYANAWSPNAYDFFIGREPGINGLPLSGIGVSRKHAKISCNNSEWIIQSLDKPIIIQRESLHITVKEQEKLYSGDLLQIGSHLLQISISYIQQANFSNVNGELCSSSIEQLDVEKIYIGSNPNNCRVLIAGADELHSLVYYKQYDDTWWIVDCASNSGVKVNGERIRNKRLYPSDKISIAGVDFLFQGTHLVFGQLQQVGLSLSFINASAVAQNEYQILKELNLHIKSGEFIGVLGPSGCGKSSFIQRIIGLDKFTSGEIRINGHTYNDFPEEYFDTISYQPQQNTLHEDLLLKEELSCFCSLHTKRNQKFDNQQVMEKLRLVGLENEKSKKISSLSGGQQRRVGIALALLREPTCLVLDEPTSGLDPATEKEVMIYLRRIANQNKTIICTTHVMENINLFDKILVLSRGYQVFWGTPSELLEYFKITNPVSLYTIFATGKLEEQLDTAKKFHLQYYSSTLYQKYRNFQDELYDLPQKLRSSSQNQVWGYWKRMFFELISFKNDVGYIWKIWSSSLFIQLIFQPFLVAIVLKIACAYNLFSDDGRKEVLFFSAVSVFWLGLNNSVRELVKERIPWRCLERLELIKTKIYLFSKITLSMLLCFFQVCIFSLFMFKFIPNFSVIEPPTADPNSIPFLWGIVFVLLIVCFMGAWIGLAISAIFKKENAAVGLLPIILIPVLFFSQPIIRNDNYADISKKGKGNFSKLAISIQSVMPCHAPEILMDLQNSKYMQKDQRSNDNSKEEQKRIFKAWQIMLRNSFLYMALALALMIVFQTNNEKKWNGR